MNDDLLSSLTPAEQTEYAARHMAMQAGVDPELVAAIGHTESGWNPDTPDSKKGAIGPMQIMPATGKMLGYTEDQLRDPVTNLQAGITLLKKYHDRYQGDPTKIAVAYNAGPGKVNKPGEWADETHGYVAKVHRELGIKAVDIPDTAPLVQQKLDELGVDDGFLHKIARSVIEPGTQLAETGARFVTGSPVPAPPATQLVSDAAQVASLGAPAVLPGRVAAAAMMGGLSAVDGLSQAVQSHQAGSWEDAMKAMDSRDAFTIGAKTVASAAMGALFAPGKTPLTGARALTEAPEQLGARIAPRSTAEMAAQHGFSLPPAARAEVDAAYAKLPKELTLDATEWANRIQDRLNSGESIPRELKSIYENLTPEMTETLGPEGDIIQVPTGKMHGTLGELLDANQRLGDMVNTKPGQTAALAQGHSLGNLRSLKGELTGEISDALRAVDRTTGSKLATTFQTAQDTALAAAQDAKAQRIVEKFLNPDTNSVAGGKMLATLTSGNRERIINTIGQDRYDNLVQYATSIKNINTDAQKGNILARLFGMHSLGYGAAAGLSSALGAPHEVVAGMLAARVAWVLASSKTVRSALDVMARAPVSSPAFLEAAGRISLAVALAGKQSADRVRPASQTGPTGAPSMFTRAARSAQPTPPPR